MEGDEGCQWRLCSRMGTSERASECCSKLCMLKGSSRALQGRAGEYKQETQPRPRPQPQPAAAVAAAAAAL